MQRNPDRSILRILRTGRAYNTGKIGTTPGACKVSDIVKHPLSTIAHGRSGDKGNHSNIAVIAYTPAGYAWLKEHLTAEVVADYFAPLAPSRVERFEAANVLGLNFMLYDALAGGASRSLRNDTQGKSFALAVLQMPFDLPADHAHMLRVAEPT